MPTTIVYCSDTSAPGRAAGQVAHELASSLAARAVPLGGTARGGRRTARRLAAVAEREGATLLVVPVERQWPLGSVLRASLCAEVVRLATCPVVLVPPRLVRADPPLLVGDHVLWAVVDHRDAGCADVAAAMARALELPLTIAHVVPGDSDEGTREASSERLAGWLLEGLVKRLAEHDPELAGRSSVRLGSGEAGPELRRMCDDDGPALAVLGSRGRGSLAAALLGSVSSHLGRHGAKAVVVCPPDARQPGRHSRTRWTIGVPLLAILALVLTWGGDPSPGVVAIVGALLAGAVLAAVHHAEVVAHRVGEPFGALVLALAVTVIEVALIVTLMVSGGPETSTLARDTVFAAVMITCNGIVGLSLLLGALHRRVAIFNAEGTGTALATVSTLATLSLVLPRFTTSGPGSEFTSAQLAFAAVASLSLYLLFVFVQTVRHRDYFLPERSPEAPPDPEEHAAPPTSRTALASLGLLLTALVAVVGLAKVESAPIEDGIAAAGLPQSAVGVVIALLVLLPETLAAARAARRDRVQTSLNLALGSAMASIGLTIPVLAVASIWLEGPLALGLEPTQIVLLAITVVVGALTVLPGRATLQQGGVHVVLLGAFLFLAASP